MSNRNQSNITFPSEIIDWLDNFLETSKAKRMGYLSRPSVAMPLLREFLEKHHPIKLEESKNGEIELVGTFDKKIILQDSVVGTIMVVIDENNKLMCYRCNEDPHDNRYVRFCLKNEELWKFLKKSNVKLIVPRNNDKDE